MDQEIGFIGLGNMGGPMASRLISAGYQLTVYDLRREAVDAMVAKGARAAASPAQVASAAATVLVSLPDPAIVRRVVLGADGVIAGTRVKAVLDLSTTGATAAREIAAALAAKGITGIDCPVSGGVSGAVNGTLAVMLAGPQALCSALEPLVKNFGRVFFVGEQAGMAQTMKLANNLLSAAAMAATSEAVAFGVKAGLDPALMIDIINAGSGRSTASESKFPKSILPRTFDFGFTTGLMYKDVKLCLEEAGAANVPMPVGQAVRGQWQRTFDEFGGDKDFTVIAQMVERAAGVEIKSRK